jgi:solute carrier family 39 (zinc transporter), member 9
MIARLSSLGTGLLLGTAMGVIIPEYVFQSFLCSHELKRTYRGVETIVEANSSTIFPSTTIAISLTSGFTCMLLVERAIHALAPHSHSHMPLPSSPTDPEHANRNSHVEFDADVELGELEREQAMAGEAAHGRPDPHFVDAAGNTQAYSLTLGLMMHALADGFALGSAATAPVDRGLSLTVFLALIIHKGSLSALHYYPLHS